MTNIDAQGIQHMLATNDAWRFDMLNRTTKQIRGRIGIAAC
jgi:hypothetical protein